MGDWDFGDTSETLILISADGYHLLDSLQNYSLLAYNIPFCVRKVDLVKMCKIFCESRDNKVLHFIREGFKI